MSAPLPDGAAPDPAAPASRAFVSLIGAGPGDPGLITLRGVEALARADVVLACSALRRGYRDTLRVGQVAFVFLNVPQALLRERLAARSGHYAGPELLPSQLATLEPPGADEPDVVALDVRAAETPADLARRALETLGVAHA